MGIDCRAFLRGFMEGGVVYRVCCWVLFGGVRVGWLCVCGVFVDCGAFLGVLWRWWCDMGYGYIYAGKCGNMRKYLHVYA